MENEEGGTSSMHKRRVMRKEFQCENLKGGEYVGDLGIDGRLVTY
jgi:hypothetical protein